MLRWQNKNIKATAKQHHAILPRQVYGVKLRFIRRIPVAIADRFMIAKPQVNPRTQPCVRYVLHVEEARDALARFEEAIQQANWPDTVFNQFAGDIDTLHGELSEPSPSPTIIRDAGISMRHTLDIITSRIEVPSVIAAAEVLWSAIGLS